MRFFLSIVLNETKNMYMKKRCFRERKKEHKKIWKDKRMIWEVGRGDPQQ